MLVALHAASNNGSPVSFFDPKHDHDAAQRLVLERGLRAALDQGGQLRPYFQPKVSAATGKIIGAEVLLRWQHPVLGFITPDRFIPLAEKVGLIHPISEWLIGHVCELISDWLAMRQEVGTISINLSAESFFQRSLIQFIDEVLVRTGVPANQLIIELTESVLMQNADTAHHVIDDLRERGIRISLDDFGTGFSSLGYLSRFSIDEIKIDRSFVSDLETEDKNRALVQAIITLGTALGLKVVAEGVETRQQADLLRQMGCDIFQGFFFARPMPAEDFISFQLPIIDCAENARLAK
jgi:EAL domain-containing protein (putative c-di-GMP-specific phosphodiesterase class I)